MVKEEYRLTTVALVVATAAAILAGRSYVRSRGGDLLDNDAKEDAAIKSRDKAAQESWESHVKEHGSLKEVWPGTLFVLEALGTDRGPPVRNMAIYRVPDKSGRLVIYNSIAVDEVTMKAIEELGTPTVLVAPNYYHRCCAAVWKKRFPDLTVFCPQVAKEKVSEIVFVDATTQEWSDMENWSKWIHTKEIDGWGEFESVIEVELDASASGKKAVLVCDLLFTVRYKDNAGFAERCLTWLFDSSIELPEDGSIVIPKVARISRIFAIQDWKKAQQWYRTYARDHGRSIGAIVVGHGVPVVEIDPDDGCTKAFEGVADQLTKPRW